MQDCSCRPERERSIESLQQMPQSATQAVQWTFVTALRPLQALIAAPSFIYLAALTVMLFRPPDLQFYHLDRIAFLALVLTAAVHLLVSEKRLDIVGPVTWPMLGLLLLALFSLLNEPYEPQDWSMFAAKWLVPFMLYQISTRIFDHPAALRRFEIFSLGVLAYLCVIAILFLLDARALIFPGYIVDETVGIHADRARGPFLQAVANGMTINMLALIALDSFRRLRLRGALAMFFFVAVPIAVLATKTRAVWLGFAGSVIVLMFSSSKRVRYACLALIVAAALAVCSAITFGNPNNSIADRFEEQSPMEFRIAMYRAGWEMFLEKPVFGWGIRDMQAELASRVEDFHQEEFFLHNTYLEILVQHGLLGIALYLWIVVDLVRLGRHAGSTSLHGQFLDRGFQSIWVVFVLVYLINASFVVMNYQFVNGLLFTFAGMLAAQNRRLRFKSFLFNRPINGFRPTHRTRAQRGRKLGHQLRTPCPFHPERNPRWRISVAALRSGCFCQPRKHAGHDALDWPTSLWIIRNRDWHCRFLVKPSAGWGRYLSSAA